MASPCRTSILDLRSGLRPGGSRSFIAGRLDASGSAAGHPGETRCSPLVDAIEADGYGRGPLLVSPLPLAAPEKIGDGGDPRLDGSLGEVAEAEDELGRLGCVRGPVVAHSI